MLDIAPRALVRPGASLYGITTRITGGSLNGRRHLDLRQYPEIIIVTLEAVRCPRTGRIGAPWAEAVLRATTTYVEATPCGAGARLIGLCRHVPLPIAIERECFPGRVRLDVGGHLAFTVLAPE